jgi:hypothetical protein
VLIVTMGPALIRSAREDVSTPFENVFMTATELWVVGFCIQTEPEQHLETISFFALIFVTSFLNFGLFSESPMFAVVWLNPPTPAVSSVCYIFLCCFLRYWAHSNCPIICKILASLCGMATWRIHFMVQGERLIFEKIKFMKTTQKVV